MIKKGTAAPFLIIIRLYQRCLSWLTFPAPTICTLLLPLFPLPFHPSSSFCMMVLFMFNLTLLAFLLTSQVVGFAFFLSPRPLGYHYSSFSANKNSFGGENKNNKAKQQERNDAEAAQRIEPEPSSSLTPTASTASISSTAQPRKGRYFSPTMLESMKSSIPLTGVVQSYLPPSSIATSHPGRLKCLCPFHDDNNPSMSVDDQKGLYMCFSCGEGGDLFKFVRKMEEANNPLIKFNEVIEIIIDNFGNGGNYTGGGDEQLSQRRFSSSKVSQGQNLTDPHLSTLTLINTAAAAFFHEKLISPLASGGGGLARTHLRERGVGVRTVKEFCLGWAPDTYSSSSGGVVEHLTSTLNFTTDDVIESGIALKGKDGKGVMERFRGRLMVPIFSGDGKFVVGFGGRHLEQDIDDDDGNGDDSQRKSMMKAKFVPSKYLNSPESPIFRKSELMFGLATCRSSLQSMTESPLTSPVIIVEGYFDALALHSCGVTTAVASMGTALTLQQLRLAAQTAILNQPRRERLRVAKANPPKESCSKPTPTPTNSIYLCFDNDEAGKNAVVRLVEHTTYFSNIEEEFNVSVRVCNLPHGLKDPGEYIERHGGAEGGIKFVDEVVLGNSYSIDDWRLRDMVDRFNATPTVKYPRPFDAVFDKAVNIVASVDSLPKRDEKAREVAKLLENLVERSTDGSMTTGGSPVLLMLEQEILAAADLKNRDGGPEKLLQRMSGDGGVSDGDMAPPEGAVRKIPITKRKKSKKMSKIPFSPPHPPEESQRQKQQHQQQYFGGLQFNDERDQLWLEDENMLLGQKRRASKNNDGKGQNSDTMPIIWQGFAGGPSKTGDNSVYFSSPELRRATVPPQESSDNAYSGALKQAEERLLRAIVTMEPSRSAMRRADSTAKTAFAEGSMMRDIIEFSSDERTWLYNLLINELPDELHEGGNIEQIREWCRSREGVKDSWFGDWGDTSLELSEVGDHESMNVADFDSGFYVGNEDGDEVKVEMMGQLKRRSSGTRTTKGLLDHLFRPSDTAPQPIFTNASAVDDSEDVAEEISFISKQQRIRAELTVQETLATLMKGNAMKRRDAVANLWRANRDEVASFREDFDVNDQRLQQLEVDGRELLEQLDAASKFVRDLHSSAKKIGQRVLDAAIAIQMGSAGSSHAYKQSSNAVSRLEEILDNIVEEKESGVVSQVDEEEDYEEEEEEEEEEVEGEEEESASDEEDDSNNENDDSDGRPYDFTSQRATESRLSDILDDLVFEKTGVEMDDYDDDSDSDGDDDEEHFAAESEDEEEEKLFHIVENYRVDDDFEDENVKPLVFEEDDTVSEDEDDDEFEDGIVTRLVLEEDNDVAELSFGEDSTADDENVVAELSYIHDNDEKDDKEEEGTPPEPKKKKRKPEALSGWSFRSNENE